MIIGKTNISLLCIMLEVSVACLCSAPGRAQCNDPPQLDWVGTNGRPGSQAAEEPIRLDLACGSGLDIGLVGAFSGDCDLDPTDFVERFSAYNYQDGFLNLVPIDGHYSGNYHMHGGGSMAVGGVTRHQNGFIYCGTFEQQPEPGNCVDFDPFDGQDYHCAIGESALGEGFISRIDDDAEYRWTGVIGGSGYDTCADVATDGDGAVFVTGFFTRTADFDPGPGEFLLSPFGSEENRDAYLLKLDSNMEFGWAYSIGGPRQDQGEGLTTDDNGNVYLMGRFSQSVDFDPGPGEDLHGSQSGSDLFVCKYTSDGQYLWTRTVNTNTGHLGMNLVLSEDSRLVISSAFRDRVDFDPTDGVDIRESTGESDAFVTVWSANGEYLWTATWGGAGYDGAHAAFDSRGDLMVAGNFNATVDFDPGPGQDFRTSLGGNDSYVARYGSDGTYFYALTFGGSDEDSVARMAVNRDNGDIWLDGLFMGTVDFDPGPGEAIRTSVGERDLFLMKMTCDGRGCEELTGHSAFGRTGSVESGVSTTLTGGKAAIKLEGNSLRFKQKARLAGDGSGATTFRNLSPGRYRAVVAKLKDAAGTRVCNGEMMERFVDVR